MHDGFGLIVLRSQVLAIKDILLNMGPNHLGNQITAVMGERPKNAEYFERSTHFKNIMQNVRKLKFDL